MEGAGGVEEHAGGGLAAVVGRIGEALAGGVADLEVGERRDERAETRVHGFDDGGGLGAAADVGLVGDDDENVAGGGEGGAGRGDTGEEFEFGEGGGRVGLAVADDLAVQGAVAVEEDGGAECRRGRGRRHGRRRRIFNPGWHG